MEVGGAEGFGGFFAGGGEGRQNEGEQEGEQGEGDERSERVKARGYFREG